MRFAALANILAVLGAQAAIAATIPAEFVVEAKPLKSATATDTVTASLYSDSACTSLVATTGAVALQDVELTESLKPFKAKSATEKPPGTVRMHFTFSTSPPSGDLFLSVTGSVAGAVVGYPSACQPQQPVSDALAVICQQLAGTPACDLASTIRNVAATPVKIFSVTNSGSGGSFGNRAATTATCAAAAVSQGLSCTSTLALLAYTGGDDIASMPSNHGVPSGVPIVAAGSLTRIANDWNDFLDGTWSTCLGGFCDPNGPAPAGLSLADGIFLTGANNDGTVDAANNCTDWSSTTGTFSIGRNDCYGASGSLFCNSGQTLATAVCNNPLCCGVPQGAMLCLCY
ncbi:MAG TPA: hypothetical protein VGK20_15855 [Candidatus Binatia bacterium]|jgi:hypothetical protein